MKILSEKQVLLFQLHVNGVEFIIFRYEIQPANDINFGALLINNKKEGQSRFEIHNRGEFDFKFIISKMQKEDKPGGRGNRP